MTERADALPVPELAVSVDLPAPTREQRRRLRRPWLLGIAVWAAAAVALNLSPLGHELNPYLSITGLFVGFLVGLTGMGGGALLTPILIFLFGFQPSLAIGTDIAYAVRHEGLRLLASPEARIGGQAGGAVAGASAAFPPACWARWPSTSSSRTTATPSTPCCTAPSAARSCWSACCWSSGCCSRSTRTTRPKDIHLSTAQGRDRGHRRLDRLSRRHHVGGQRDAAGHSSSSCSIRWRPRRVVGTDVFHATLLLGATALVQLRFGNVDLWMVATLLLGLGARRHRRLAPDDADAHEERCGSRSPSCSSCPAWRCSARPDRQPVH